MWFPAFLLLVISLILLFLLLSIAITVQYLRISQLPKDIPWAGLNDRWLLPKPRACLSELSVGRAMATEGYERYGRHGKPFILPGLHWPGIVLPPCDVKWLVSQPESQLSAVKALDSLVGFDYLSHGPNTESVHDFTAIARDLTRRMGDTIPIVFEELAVSLDKRLNSKDWKEIKLVETLNEVAFESISRIFIGLPMSRDKGYAKAVQDWMVAFGITSGIMRYLIPYSLRSWVMPVLSLPAYLFQYRAARYLLPEIHRRLKLQKSRTPPAEPPPNDMLQWILTHNASKPNPAELEPLNIAGRLLLFNVFATVTTPTVAGLVLIDLLSHSKAPELLETLHAEAAQSLPQVPTKPTALRDMKTLDSAIRETLRCHPMGARGLMREVLAPGGLVAPASGTYLPRGSHVEALSCYMHLDPSIHAEDAADYDPLRFCREEATPTEKQSAVQISEHFLSFGLGKHACPGRFFAVAVIKILLGQLLLKYDIELLEKRPEMFEFGDAVMPSDKTQIRVRRRKVADPHE